MSKIAKGDKGYLSHLKTINLIKVIISFVIVLVVFFAGIIINGDRNSLFTVIAILLVLPAAKMAVNYIVLLPHKSCPYELCKELSEVCTNVTCKYDLIFGNSKSPIGTLAVVITDTDIIAFSNENVDEKSFSKSLEDFIKNDNLTVKVKLINNEKTFIKRAKELNQKWDSENNSSNRMEKNTRSCLSMCI